MNLQEAVQPKAAANGYVRRRVDRDMGASRESKMHSRKPAFSNIGLLNDGKIGGVGSPSRDRLIYVVTDLIGHHVEVHVKNGSIISGIFHTANPEKDFEIVLKMAQVVKDGSVGGQKFVPDTVKKPQTMIVPARELVQVIAKDLPLSSDEFTNGHAHERHQDFMIDSAISHSHNVEVQRELEHWTPDQDDPKCPELENIFDGTWNRNWDQFETNEALFGVKSTFDEELYTTKLVRGPQMRELERKASRIAREIEGEDTHDQHLAEERGVLFNEDLDFDEESRYSAVRREVDDGEFEENENSFSDAYNTETFGSSLDSLTPRFYSDISRKEVIDEAQASSTCSLVDEEASSQIQADKDAYISDSIDCASQLTSDCIINSLSMDDESRTNIRLDEKQIKDQIDEKSFLNECIEKTTSEEAQSSKSEDIKPAMNIKGLSPNATSYDRSSSGQANKHSISESSESPGSGKSSAANEPTNSSLRSGSSTSSTSENVGPTTASSGPGLSPSSSAGSLSSEKSKLNPYAKEFKLNANAKSFAPSASLRPHAPVSEGSFYYANNISAVPHMHNLPVGVGFGPSFGGHQPVYNPQGAQMQPPQAFFHPSSPLYGQQMILGQPRPVFYMPTYQPEAPYKGRNF